MYHSDPNVNSVLSQRKRMLTCIARPKKLGDDSLSQPEESDTTNTPGAKTQSIKSLTSQVEFFKLLKTCENCVARFNREG
jgi:hypothetical protein